MIQNPNPQQIREKILRAQPFPDSLPLWDRCWFRVVYALAFLQEIILWRVVREPCWRAGDGRVWRVSQMDERYIRSCMSLLDRNGQSKDRVYTHFARELNKRYQIRMSIGANESDAFLRHHQDTQTFETPLEPSTREGTRELRPGPRRDK